VSFTATAIGKRGELWVKLRFSHQVALGKRDFLGVAEPVWNIKRVISQREVMMKGTTGRETEAGRGEEKRP